MTPRGSFSAIFRYDIAKLDDISSLSDFGENFEGNSDNEEELAQKVARDEEARGDRAAREKEAREKAEREQEERELLLKNRNENKIKEQEEKERQRKVDAARIEKEQNTPPGGVTLSGK